MKATWFHWIWTVSLAVIALGCGGSSIPTYKAGGKVMFPDRVPLPGGWISFRSLESEGNHSARGEIQPDGTFELTTFSSGDGAVGGKHQAMIAIPTHSHRDGYPDPPALPTVDRKFSNFETSGLVFVVTDNPAENRFEIAVTKGR